MAGTRVFRGNDDTGEPFAILYSADGVRWIRGPAAEAVRPSGAPRPAAGAGLTSALNAAAGVVGIAAQVVQAVAGILEWWELRQYRQMDQARFEEERRIPWTYDMMARWVAAHRDGEHLDLEISHFLARETSSTLKGLVENPKMGIPQAMLYDLEQMRRAISALRTLLGQQFRALERAEDFNASAIVAKNLPRQNGAATTLNFDCIRRWAADPREDWDRALLSKDMKSFENELSEMTRRPGSVLEKAFGYTMPETKTQKGGSPSPSIWAGVAGAWLAGPLGGLAFYSLTHATYFVFEKLRDADALRRDDFRELALFAAEVERTRLLHKLWCVIDAMVRNDRGAGLLVSEAGGQLQLAARSRDSDDYETIASKSDALVLQP